MSYTSRHRYKNRREKFESVKRKTTMTLVIIGAILFFLAIYFWQNLKDWWALTFG